MIHIHPHTHTLAQLDLVKILAHVGTKSDLSSEATSTSRSVVVSKYAGRKYYIHTHLGDSYVVKISRDTVAMVILH